ncbi:MAG: hypothetical protein WKG52_09625 [Variovorax sp.]
MSSSQSLICPQVDFVSTDVDALALHMRHCAREHGRWFSVRSKLQHVRSAVAGRIVTMACLVVVLGIGLFAIA